jgi:hypothetical protein
VHFFQRIQALKEEISHYGGLLKLSLAKLHLFILSVCIKIAAFFNLCKKYFSFGTAELPKFEDEDSHFHRLMCLKPNKRGEGFIHP